MFVFVVVLDVGIVVKATLQVVVVVLVVDLNVDDVVQATSKVDLRLLVMEDEFGWVVGCWVWWCVNPFSCQTQLS